MCMKYDRLRAILGEEGMASRGLIEPTFAVCEDCGGKIHMGEHPFCGGDPDKHDKPLVKHRPFRSFYDPHIRPMRPGEDPRGVEITSLHKWDRELRENNLEVCDAMKEHTGKKDAEREREADAALEQAFERAWGEACQEVVGGDLGTARVD